MEILLFIQASGFHGHVIDLHANMATRHIRRWRAQTLVTSNKPEREAPGRLLSEVSKDKGFHFYTGLGSYTGIYATSLEQFSRLLKRIEIESIDFHMPRRDFENWVRSLGDSVLALNLAKLKGKNASGEKLREELVKIVERRLDKLGREQQHGKSTSKGKVT